MASEESICELCYYNGECDDQAEAKKYGKLIGDCPDFKQEEE